MGFAGWTGCSAALARGRLLDDQLMRPRAEQRSRLAILATRLEDGGRTALIRALAGRAGSDPRFRPLLRRLMHPARPPGPGRQGLLPGGRIIHRA